MNSECMREPRLVFWDFDGVIKDSVEIKGEAFEAIFAPFGSSIARRVRAHHGDNGGMSRMEKIPQYLAWSGEPTTDDRVEQICKRFSEMTLQAVIDAAWVPGAEEYLRTNTYGQTFILVTATPQDEIEIILERLRLRDCFAEVWGAPTTKAAAIRDTLASRRVDPRQCLMIGDARSDMMAARKNDVPFLLRKHVSNGQLIAEYDGPTVEDFGEL